jgi:phage gp16-like protein
MATPADRKRMLATLHIAIGQLGLDDDTYRAWLETTFGVRSAGGLSVGQLGRALELLREMGWQPLAKPGRSTASPVARKIWALWHALGRAGKLEDDSNGALRAFVLKMTGATDPRFLDTQAAHKVIEGLKAWLDRDPVQRAAEPS